VYGFADEMEKIDTQNLEKVIEELGFIGLYNKTDYAQDAGHFESAEAGDNGFLERFQDLEHQMQKLGMQIGQQNVELKRLLSFNKDKLIDTIKDLILGKRQNSEKLRIENELLKRKLKELERKLPQNVLSLKGPASKKIGP
jgi:hypothetical protein